MVLSNTLRATDIFTWALDPITIHLFSICNRPSDVTPPVASAATVTVLQLDALTISVEFGGFQEPDGKIERCASCSVPCAAAAKVTHPGVVGTAIPFVWATRQARKR